MSGRINKLGPATGDANPLQRASELTFAALLVRIMALAELAAFAHLYRDTSATSSYWSVYTTGGATLHYLHGRDAIHIDYVVPTATSRRSRVPPPAAPFESRSDLGIVRRAASVGFEALINTAMASGWCRSPNATTHGSLSPSEWRVHPLLRSSPDRGISASCVDRRTPRRSDGQA